MYHEKFLTLGNAEAAPAQKAMTSVIDVIVIAIPLVLIVWPTRVSTSSLLDVFARPDKRMNMSSTPIPTNITWYYIVCRCLIILLYHVYSHSHHKTLHVILRFFSLSHGWPYLTVADFGWFCFIAPKTLNYLAFHSFDIERTWWRLFLKRIVHTKFDIYVFILNFIIPKR